MLRKIHHLRFGLILLLFLFFLSFAAKAQSECQKNLEISKELYENGALEEIVYRLRFCAFNKNLVRPLRRDILNLLTQTYLFLGEREEARKTYEELLTLDPFNRVNPGIPEVKYLEAEYETYPFTTYSFFWGLQLNAKPKVKNFYSPEGVAKSEVNYQRKGEDPFGWHAGFNVAVKLFNTNLDASLGYTHAKYTFHYNALLENAQTTVPGVRDIAELDFLEQHRWSQFSLSLVYQFAPRERVIHRILIPYVHAGISTNILHKGSAQIVAPSLTFQNLPEENDANFGIVDISDLRTHMSTSLILGGGIRFHVKRYFLQFDVRHYRFLTNLADAKNRSSNELLRETFNYLDDDFTMSSTGFSLGMGFYLFKSQKKVR